ncbi:MAG: glycoside hydrolase family 3 C-terminal domain-containing protein, partial [Bacilli bacterium]|nr:glycoside hydrolase family 3 C-terminal domain-containing protein [Bacilli bacterium]
GYITRYNLIQPFGMKRALLEAKKADKIILCVGTTLREEKEESDKDTYRLNENIYDLIVELNKINENIILVLYTGGPVELYEVNNLVKGIVYAGLGGEGVSKALSHILTNKVCPSGKLSESFIYFKEDSYASKGNYFYEKYDEGVLVGYKNYLTNDIPVLYEFGFGLSYATFKYSNLKIKDLGSLNFEISFDVTNDSDIDAKNVTEIYIGNRLRMVETSVKSLVNFDKTFFKAHETKNIKVKLNKDSFSYFNVMLNDFYVEDGIYDIYVSTSLTVDELKGQIEIKEGKFKYSRF